MADPSSGTLALAYQGQVRQTFSTDPFIIGSHVVVARIGPGGPASFLALPTYVERISTLGLSVRQGETWVAYRPIDQATLAFDCTQADALFSSSAEFTFSAFFTMKP